MYKTKIIILLILLFSIQNIITAQEQKKPDTTNSSKETTEKNKLEKPLTEPEEKNEKKKSIGKTIISLDPLIKKTKDEKKWFFTLGGGFSFKKGNTNNITANGTTSIKFDNNIASFIASYRTFYGETKKVMDEHNGIGTLKFDYYVHPRIELFIFTIGEYDVMKKLIFRNNTGLGMKLVLFRNKYHTTDLSAAPTYQYEKYKNENEKMDARASFRFRTSITPVDILKLYFVGFYVPQFINFNNFRIELETYLDIRILKFDSDKRNLLFRTGYIRKYNSHALAGTKKTDDHFYINIILKL